MDIKLSPVRPCHLLTAKRRLAVTVMMADEVRPCCVLAATWVTGEFDGNFNTMITSCCICSVNISGVCRRRYCSGRRDGQRDAGRRYKVAEREWKAEKRGTKPQSVLARKKQAEGEGGKGRKEGQKVRKYEQHSSEQQTCAGKRVCYKVWTEKAKDYRKNKTTKLHGCPWSWNKFVFWHIILYISIMKVYIV